MKRMAEFSVPGALLACFLCTQIPALAQNSQGGQTGGQQPPPAWGQSQSQMNEGQGQGGGQCHGGGGRHHHHKGGGRGQGEGQGNRTGSGQTNS